MRKLFADQKGDTIVEVLLAVAVLSSVLGASYAIMNRNIITLRDNQERIEASKYAQGQIESLIGLWKTRQTDVLAQGGTGFCINSLTAPISTISGGSPTSNPASDNLTANYGSCTQGLYSYGIRRTDAATNTYRIYVRWEAVSGREQINEVVYTHRLGG